MTRPIDMLEFPFTFTYDGVVYKELEADKYVRVEKDGSETPLDKEKSNELMEALIAGEVVK